MRRLQLGSTSASTFSIRQNVLSNLSSEDSPKPGTESHVSVDKLTEEMPVIVETYELQQYCTPSRSINAAYGTARGEFVFLVQTRKAGKLLSGGILLFRWYTVALSDAKLPSSVLDLPCTATEQVGGFDAFDFTNNPFNTSFALDGIWGSPRAPNYFNDPFPADSLYDSQITEMDLDQDEEDPSQHQAVPLVDNRALIRSPSTTSLNWDDWIYPECSG